MTAPASSPPPDPLPLRALLDDALLWLSGALFAGLASYWLADEIYPHVGTG
jgi:hypothetical protein